MKKSKWNVKTQNFDKTQRNVEKKNLPVMFNKINFNGRHLIVNVKQMLSVNC